MIRKEKRIRINSLSGAIEAHQTSNLGVVGSSPTWDVFYSFGSFIDLYTLFIHFYYYIFILL